MKNSSIFDIVYCFVGVLTRTSLGFQKCGDGISQDNDGDVICSARIVLPFNAKDPKSSPIANTLIALALPAQAPDREIIRSIYLSFQTCVWFCRNTSDIGPPIPKILHIKFISFGFILFIFDTYPCYAPVVWFAADHPTHMFPQPIPSNRQTIVDFHLNKCVNSLIKSYLFFDRSSNKEEKVHLLGALRKSYGAPRKVTLRTYPLATNAFPMSLKYAPANLDDQLGSSHSTTSDWPKPGIRSVTPGIFRVVRVTLSYMSLTLSIQQSITSGTNNFGLSQILKKSDFFSQ